MTAHSAAVARALDEGVVVDFGLERARRRGEGWPALEAELTEVPGLVDVASSGSCTVGAGSVAAGRDVEHVQLSIFGGGE